ncbi:unnamed protein product [Chrysodeixis includens]|uniref:unspecific monooxygenase n=2 Tax=Chrysodeixis includens TaxID=689277 RepID=A0A9P0BQG1_CHRIL|nr:unnamed protein product [Chrysodeixis includens]
MYILLLFTLVSVCVAWLYLKWMHMKSYWVNKGVPQGPIHPLFGSMTFLQKKNPGKWMQEVYDQFKQSPYVGIWVFWRPGLVVNSPELARQVLVKDADVFRNRLLRSGQRDPLGALNLFTVDDPLWSSIRRRLTAVFTASKLRGWHELYQSKVTDLVERIRTDNEKGVSVNLRSLFADYATDIIGESSFGIQCQATKNSSGPLRAMTQEFEKYSKWRGMGWSSMFFLPEMVDICGFSFWPQHTVDYFRKIFSMMVKERGGLDKEVDGKRDLLDALLKMRQDALKDNQDMNLDILVSNAMIFLQGGYDTSSSALMYICYELAYHPEYQQRLFEELSQAKEKLGGREFEASDLAELPFLNAVFNETIRKYPIMGWLDRVALRDYQIDEHLTIKAGTVVYVNAVGMHKDSQYFPEPDKFLPERFLPENVKDVLPYTFMPFGEGPRACIGKRIGQNTVRYALAAVVLNFEIRSKPGELEPNDIEQDKRQMFYAPAQVLSVDFVSRK